jgi:hypothetical protein
LARIIPVFAIFSGAIYRIAKHAVVTGYTVGEYTIGIIAVGAVTYFSGPGEVTLAAFAPAVAP